MANMPTRGRRSDKMGWASHPEAVLRVRFGREFSDRKLRTGRPPRGEGTDSSGQSAGSEGLSRT